MTDILKKLIQRPKDYYSLSVEEKFETDKNLGIDKFLELDLDKDELEIYNNHFIKRIYKYDKSKQLSVSSFVLSANAEYLVIEAEPMWRSGGHCVLYIYDIMKKRIARIHFSAEKFCYAIERNPELFTSVDENSKEWKDFLEDYEVNKAKGLLLGVEVD